MKGGGVGNTFIEKLQRRGNRREPGSDNRRNENDNEITWMECKKGILDKMRTRREHKKRPRNK